MSNQPLQLEYIGSQSVISVQRWCCCSLIRWGQENRYVRLISFSETCLAVTTFHFPARNNYCAHTAANRSRSINRLPILLILVRCTANDNERPQPPPGSLIMSRTQSPAFHRLTELTDWLSFWADCCALKATWIHLADPLSALNCKNMTLFLERPGTVLWDPWWHHQPKQNYRTEQDRIHVNGARVSFIVLLVCQAGRVLLLSSLWVDWWEITWIIVHVRILLKVLQFQQILLNLTPLIEMPSSYAARSFCGCCWGIGIWLGRVSWPSHWVIVVVSASKPSLSIWNVEYN